MNRREFVNRDLPAEKLFFGSDGPLVDARVELYKIRLPELPPGKEALVLAGNIRRLLGLMSFDEQLRQWLGAMLTLA